MILGACTASETLPEKACRDVELIVAASDRSSSVICGAPGCALGARTTGDDLGGDPQLATQASRPFLLARENDYVFELDPACGTPIARFSVHDLAKDRGRANPHDAVAAADGSVFVVLYDVPRIAIVRGDRMETSIDLSGYDEDGNPQAEAIRIVPVGGVPKAFVPLERLDDGNALRSTRPSQMLRIDVATRSIEGATELAGRNPFNTMAEQGGALYLAEPGNFDDAAETLAGIERFEASTQRTAILVSEAALGGSVAEIALAEGCGVAIVAGPERDVNPTSLVTFDPKTGTVFASARAPLFGPTRGYDLQGLAFRGRTLFVGDRRRGPDGYPVHVFERTGEGCELTLTPRVLLLPQMPVALRPAR